MNYKCLNVAVNLFATSSFFFAPEEESQVRFDENAFFNWA